jgi:hypothetical protein
MIDAGQRSDGALAYGGAAGLGERLDGEGRISYG